MLKKVIIALKIYIPNDPRKSTKRNCKKLFIIIILSKYNNVELEL